MSDAPYMQLYVGDYMRDTRLLSLEQRGAYTDLLCLMWGAGGWLPADPVQLARSIGASTKQWARIWAGIGRFFIVENGQITQKRLLCERQKWSAKSENRRMAGALGGKAKALKDNGVHLANAIANASDLPQQKASILESESERTSSIEDVAPPPKPTPRSELETILDPAHAAAVIEHRQALRKPLKAYAAKLLAKKFARCPDPNAAADAMIAAGWQGFEPEWLEGRTAHRGQAPPNGNGRGLDPMISALKRRYEACDEDGRQDDNQGHHGTVPGLPAPRAGGGGGRFG